MESLRILIVDDELPVRQELSVFPWEKYGCCWVGEAKNGKEALQLCAELKPDIVITDIAMPTMDGLELAQKLKTLYPNVQIIILTSYQNFEYAKIALKLDVLDYIVKFEMRENEIAAVLRRAQKYLADSGMLERLARKELRSKLVTLCAKARTERTASKQAPEQINYILDKLGILSTHLAECVFLLLDIPDNYSASVDVEISEYMESNPSVKSWAMLDSGLYVVYLCSVEPRNLHENVEILEDGIKAYLAALLEISQPYAVVYPPAETVHQFLFYIAQYPCWSETHFYAPHSPLHHSLNLIKTIPIGDAEETKLLELFSLLEDSGERFENDFIRFAVGHCLDISQLKNFAVEQIHAYYRKHHKKYCNPLTASILDAGSISELAATIRQECTAEVQYRHEVEKAVQIIMAEYALPLTLTCIASRVGLSPQYLSRIFREESGETFNDCLTRVRIEQAQRLVIEGRYKIYEIAELVGIPNYRYFSTLFRKSTGNSPKHTKKGDNNE